MRVTNIKKEGCAVYSVTLTPNCFEKLFGIQEKMIKVRRTSNSYTFGGQNEYQNPDGSSRGNNDYVSEEIDKFLRKW